MDVIYKTPKAIAKDGAGVKTNIYIPTIADTTSPKGIAFNLEGESASIPPIMAAEIIPRDTIDIGTAVSPVVKPYFTIRKGAKYVIKTVDPIL
jgi:hypothetical protein